MLDLTDCLLYSEPTAHTAHLQVGQQTAGPAHQLPPHLSYAPSLSLGINNNRPVNPSGLSHRVTTITHPESMVAPVGTTVPMYECTLCQTTGLASVRYLFCMACKKRGHLMGDRGCRMANKCHHCHQTGHFQAECLIFCLREMWAARARRDELPYTWRIRWVLRR